jgi:hypothetical protein
MCIQVREICSVRQCVAADENVLGLLGGGRGLSDEGMSCGRPAAAMAMSAVATTWSRSTVREWRYVTVAFRPSSST